MILKDIGMPDHLTCFLKNLYAGQEKTVRTSHMDLPHQSVGLRNQGLQSAESHTLAM